MKMNRERITVILGLILTALCAASLLTTIHVSRQMSSLTDKAISEAYEVLNHAQESENPAFLIKKIDEIENAWQKYEPIVSTYSRHNEVERVSKAVQKLRPLLECRRTDEVYTTLHEIRDALDHLRKTELPSAANIL